MLLERKVIDRIKSKWTGIDVIETDKRKESRIDNLIVKDKELLAIAEIKCRNLTLPVLNQYGTWLITNQKLKDGATISELLVVPFLGFLYLVPDDLLLYWKITDNTGQYLFEFKANDSRTQATCNGGETIRENAYLPVKFAKFI